MSCTLFVFETSGVLNFPDLPERARLQTTRSYNYLLQPVSVALQKGQCSLHSMNKFPLVLFLGGFVLGV